MDDNRIEVVYIVGLGSVVEQETTVQKINRARTEVDESNAFISINVRFDLMKVDGVYDVNSIRNMLRTVIFCNY